MNTELLNRVGTPAATLPHFDNISDALAAYQGDDHITCFFPDRIKQAADIFVDGFPGTVMYAVKANPHPFILQTLWESGVTRFDVASIREIQLVKHQFDGAQLYLMHPVKSRRTIEFAYAEGVRDFALDHMDELQKILDCTGFADDLNLHIRLALPKGGAVMPLAGKFGADRDSAVELLARARQYARRLGICFHVGSQCMNPDDFRRAIAYAAELTRNAGVRLDTLDVGGGFPVAYPGMEIPPMQDYFDAVSAQLNIENWTDIELLGEPGRALCAEGGSTLARIELRKDLDLYLNDGSFGTLFDAGHFAWKFPVHLHRNRPPNPMNQQKGFRLFGPTCDSADVMPGPFYLPADASEGDWIEFENLGAYGQALTTTFNGFYSDHTVIITNARD